MLNCIKDRHAIYFQKYTGFTIKSELDAVWLFPNEIEDCISYIKNVMTSDQMEPLLWAIGDGGGDMRSDAIREKIGAFTFSNQLIPHRILHRKIQLIGSEISLFSDLALIENDNLLSIGVDQITSSQSARRSLIALADHEAISSDLNAVPFIQSLEKFFIEKKQISTEDDYLKVLSSFSNILEKSIESGFLILISLSDCDGIVAIAHLQSPKMINCFAADWSEKFHKIANQGLNCMFI